MHEIGSAPTVLDVVENVFGSRPTVEQVEKLSQREFDELRDRLSEFWEAQGDQEIRGGAYLLGDWVHAFWSDPIMRQDLSDSLLYYSNLLVLDPLADFFGDRSVLPETRGIRYRRHDGRYNTVSGGPRMWSSPASFEAMRHSDREVRGHVARVLKNLFDLEPLVRSGVLVLRSQWPTLRDRAQQLATSVRHDIRSPQMQAIARAPRGATDALAVWDNLRGAQVRMHGPVHPADEPWQTEAEFFYLAKTLAVADAANSQYVPSTQVDLDLLRGKVNTGLPLRHPRELLREVSRVLVPSLNVPIKRAIEMRESSENFQDWRSLLDQLRATTTANTERELGEQVQDELRPRARAIERELKRTSLGSYIRDSAAELVITGAVGVGTALATKEGLVTVGTGLGAGVLTWMVRAYTRQQPGGADAVLAALVRKP